MNHRARTSIVFLFALGGFVLSCSDPSHSRLKHGVEWSDHVWGKEQIDRILSMSQSQLINKPKNTASNRYASDRGAAALGKALFFDPSFSKNAQVSCSTCHSPDYGFTDPAALSTGIAQVSRHSMSVVNAQFSPWLFWDGRSDSLWAQALQPLEDAAEHGSNRLRIARTLAGDAVLKGLYEPVFGSLADLSDAERFPQDASPLSSDPEEVSAWQGMAAEDQGVVDRIFSNLGKALASYEGSIFLTASRFDQFAEALRFGNENVFLNENEMHGLQIFLTKGHCVECHSGPLFSNQDFHNTGIPQNGGTPDSGRFEGVERMLADPFNCLGTYSDAANKPKDCAETRFAKHGDEWLKGTFKVPSLRNVADTAPYMHAGQVQTLEEAIDHYDRAPAASIGRSELFPLQLTPEEKQYLLEFLMTLSSIPLEGI